MTKIWCHDWNESVYTDAAPVNPKSLIGIPLTSGQKLAGILPDRLAVELRSGNCYSDFAMAGPMFLVSEKLKVVLDQYNPTVEYFEVSFDTKARMYFFNLLETIDCLDLKNSKYEIEYGAAVVERLALESVVNEPPLYRIAETNSLVIAVREDLAESMVSANATGVLLKRVEDWTNPMFP